MMMTREAYQNEMKGIRWLYENVDYEYANDIVRINAENYLGVEKLPVYGIQERREKDYYGKNNISRFRWCSGGL